MLQTTGNINQTSWQGC